MGVTAEMAFIFKREKHARWATHIAESIIKVTLAKQIPAFAERLELESYGSLIEAYSANEDELRGYNPAEVDPNCALAWLERRGTHLVVERCADIVYPFALNESALKSEPFPQICLAYAIRFPQVPFAAYCRWEQTTSGAVALTRVSWDGERMRFRRHSGDKPFDETRIWDTWDMLGLRIDDSGFVVCEEAASPLERHYRELLDEARVAHEAGDAAGVLYFTEAAEALSGCESRPEAALLRGLALEHLQRKGVRRVMELRTREVPEELRSGLASAEPVTEGPLGGGRFVLKVQEQGFVIVDSDDGSVVAGESDVWNCEPTRVVHDFLVLSGGRYFLIDWEYVVENPLESMW